jgi:hypothetical protein
MERSKTVLDREIILQTLLGYAEVNRITDAERFNRLKQRTDRESLALFAELYKKWESSGKKENWQALAQRRDEEFIALRQLLDRIARRRGK